MINLDIGFSRPYTLRYKKTYDDDEDEGQNHFRSIKMSLDSDKGDEKQGDENFVRIPLPFLKYWPSKEDRMLWSEYL